MTRLTRAELLRRGAGAAAVLATGGGAWWWLEDRDGPGAETREEYRFRHTHHFHSRPDLKPLSVDVVTHDAATGEGLLFLAPSSGPGQRGPMIVDNAGHVVWFAKTSPDTAMNLRVQTYKGEPVLTWWQALPGHGLGNGTHVVVDTAYRELARFPAGNGLPSDLHELLLTPEDTALVTSFEIQPDDLSAYGGRKRGKVMGGVAQELEIPSARVLHEWRSIDHVGLDESHSRVGNAWDYFHINSIDVAPDGHLVISARNTWAIYKVHRDTGEVLWRLGGKKSDFRLGRGVMFAWQHDARMHDGGRVLTLFDNGAGPAVEPQSRALKLALDERARRATLIRAYAHRPAVSADAMGNAQVLPNGNLVVGWGTQPWLTEYADDGAVRLDATLPRGGQNYRAFRFPWRGRPAEPPAAAVVGGALYASWNGSTELAAWRLETGVRPRALTAAHTTPKHGFETRLELPRGARHAVAVALDVAGDELARSAPVRAA